MAYKSINEEIKDHGGWLRQHLGNEDNKLDTVGRYSFSPSIETGLHSCEYTIRKKSDILGPFLSRFIGRKLLEMNQRITFGGVAQSIHVFDGSLMETVDRLVEEINHTKGANYSVYDASSR